jgi:phospholipase C
MLLRSSLLTVTLLFIMTPASPAPTKAEGGLDKLKHIVVIFQENVSFDHYFGVYPHAANPPGQPQFHARPDTPSVNGFTPGLLERNPNGVNPFRLGRDNARTCRMNHAYAAEQKAYNRGALDRFPEFATGRRCADRKMAMAYFDGNTVTALWNIAQRFAMSDNFFGSTYGPSTPGAINLISGQTGGAEPRERRGAIVNGTLIGDVQPAFDECRGSGHYGTAQLAGRNVGDLLNARKITWGWFQGGFRPSSRVSGKAVCKALHVNSGGNAVIDYIAHHEPFQYYKSTSNPGHLPPGSTALIGHDGDQANHQYDLLDFWEAVEAGNMPAVAYLKAPAYQDGHTGYSDPLSEQTFIARTVNRLQRRPEWAHMAIVIAYDDSDGWYDHVMPPLVSPSNLKGVDSLTGPGACGASPPGAVQGRCGFGPRLPLLVLSPFARNNYVDHALLDQSSILRLIEDRFQLGRIGGDSFDGKAASMEGLFDFRRPNYEPLFLDLKTGEVADAGGK